MGTEAVIPLFGPLFLGCLVLLVVLAARRQRGIGSRDLLLGVGRRRIARGYLASIAVAVAIAVWMTQGQLRWGLEFGSYRKEAAFEYAVELFLFYLVTFGVLVVFVLTVVGLPLLALLRRLNFNSIVGVIFLSLVVSAGISWLLDASIIEVAAVCIVVAVGFACGAKLPLCRSRVCRLTHLTSPISSQPPTTVAPCGAALSVQYQQAR